MPSVLHDANHTCTQVLFPKTESQEVRGGRLDRRTTQRENASSTLGSTSNYHKTSLCHRDEDILITKESEWPLSLNAGTSMMPVVSTTGIPSQQEDKRCRSSASAVATQKAPTHPRRSIVTLQGGTISAKPSQHHYDHNVNRLRGRCEKEHGAPLPSGHSNGGTIMIFDQNVMVGTLAANKFLTSDIDIIRNDVVATWLLQQQQQQQALRSAQAKAMDETSTRSSSMLLETCNALLALKDTTADTTIC
jgi:hypothetical protein